MYAKSPGVNPGVNYRWPNRPGGCNPSTEHVATLSSMLANAPCSALAHTESTSVLSSAHGPSSTSRTRVSSTAPAHTSAGAMRPTYQFCDDAGLRFSAGPAYDTASESTMTGKSLTHSTPLSRSTPNMYMAAHFPSYATNTPTPAPATSHRSFIGTTAIDSGLPWSRSSTSGHTYQAQIPASLSAQVPGSFPSLSGGQQSYSHSVWSTRQENITACTPEPSVAQMSYALYPQNSLPPTAYSYYADQNHYNSHTRTM